VISQKDNNMIFGNPSLNYIHKVYGNVGGMSIFRHTKFGW